MAARALIPAAGASRRMGGPKLLLPWRGGTVLGAVVEALRHGGVGPILLVTAPGDRELAAWARERGIELAVNPDPERGMLSSVWAGLEAWGGAGALATAGDPLLVTPGDHPAVEPATVGLLLQRLREGGAAAAVPAYRGRRGHPLVLAARAIAEIPSLDPAVGLRQLLDRLAADVLEVPVDDPGVLTDLDTPEDYAAAGPEPDPPGSD